MEENLTLARAIQVATRIEEAIEGAKAVTASASPAPTPDDKNVNAVKKYKKKYKPTGTGSRLLKVQNESNIVIDVVRVSIRQITTNVRR